MFLHTHGCAHSIGLGIDEASNLCEVAVALSDKLNGGGLHEESVVGREHPVDALLHTLHHHRMPPAAHELPHLVIGGDLGFLEGCGAQQLDTLYVKFIVKVHIIQSTLLTLTPFLRIYA